MSPARRVKTRTQPCTPEQARKRLADARKFLELAELAGEESDVTSFNVAAANAALAGIAAADAACCRALGERSRAEDHRDAIALVAQVSPGGAEASSPTRRDGARDVRATAGGLVRPVDPGSAGSCLPSYPAHQRSAPALSRPVRQDLAQRVAKRWP